MNENEKLAEIIDVMKAVLQGGPLGFIAFRNRCFAAFEQKWGDGSSEITVDFAKAEFGSLREFDPPFTKRNGKMHLASRQTQTVGSGRQSVQSRAAASQRQTSKSGKKGAKQKTKTTTKKEVIARIDKLLEDQLSQREIGLVLKALEDVIVEEFAENKADKFTITRVLTLEIDREEQPPKFLVRPLSRLKEIS